MPARRLPLLLLAVLLASLLPIAASAATLTLTGALRTSGGGPVADGAYVLLVKLYDQKDAQLFVWEDTLTGVQVQGGAFATELGTTIGKPLPDALLTAGKPLWLGVQVGSDPELERRPLGRVPAAWHAQVAAGLACTGCVTGDMLADGTVSSAKVGFGYAGSDSKGGPAKEALLAKTAEHATVADSALLADTAKTATKATSAEEAAGLQCSGCVGLNHLAKSVAEGFVATTGGKVAGTLQVEGKLVLGGSLLEGGRIAALDTKQAACGLDDLGRVAIDSANKRLYFCDGGKWQRLTVCAEVCPPTSTVACGQPMTNACGDVGTCPSSGTSCPAGKQCQDGQCLGLGEGAATAMASCKALQQADASAKSGVYWLDPDGSGPGEAFQTHCELQADGGGWTLALKSGVNNAELHYDAALWTQADLLNPTDLDLKAAKNAKYASFNSLAVTELRITLNGVTKTFTLTAGAKGKTLLQLTSAPLDKTGETVEDLAGKFFKPVSFWSLTADGHEGYICSNLSFVIDNYPDIGSVARIGFGLSQEFPCGHNGTAEGFGLKDRGSDLDQLGSGRLQWENETNYWAAGTVWVR